MVRNTRGIRRNFDRNKRRCNQSKVIQRERNECRKMESGKVQRNERNTMEASTRTRRNGNQVASGTPKGTHRTVRNCSRGGRGIIPQVRRLKILKQDVTRFGMTPGCGGCQAANRGGPARNHSEECRKRITEELRNSGDIRFEKEQEKMEKLEPEEQQEQQQQSGGSAAVDDEMPALQEEEDSDDEKENEEMAGEDSEDEKAEDDRMDSGVMQISGLTLRSRKRIEEIGQKKKQEWDDGKTRKWDDDVNRMKEQLKEYGKNVEFHITEVYSPPRVNAMAQECG